MTDISSVFWSFIHSVNRLKAEYKDHFYRRVFRLPHHPVKIHESMLFGVTHYDFDIAIDVSWSPEGYLVFPNIATLIKGIGIIYAYQHESEYKNYVTQCIEIIQDSDRYPEQIPHDVKDEIADLLNQLML